MLAKMLAGLMALAFAATTLFAQEQTRQQEDTKTKTAITQPGALVTKPTTTAQKPEEQATRQEEKIKKSPAHTGAAEHLTMEEIVVTDQREDSQSTVVGVKTIEKGKNTNLVDVLKNEADIDVKRRVSVGDTADILSIRGLSANRIMLTINGRSVDAAGVVGGYYIDWSTIPLDNIEKIEIIRGGSSALYGNNALGGVINVITKKPTEKPMFTLYGNYGTGSGINDIQNYRLTHTYKIGPIGYSLAASYQKASPFLWNNDFEGRNFAAAVFADMPFKGELMFGFQFAETIRGFIRQNRGSTNPNDANFYVKRNSDYPLAFGETFSPYSGRAFDPGPGAKWDKTKYYFDVGYKQPIGNGLLELRAYKNIEDRNEKNYSSNAIVGSYADGVLVLDRKVESDRSYGGSIQLTEPLGSHELIAGMDYKVLAYGDIMLRYIDLTYNNRSYTGGPASQEGTAWGYYVQDTWKATGRATITAGLRYDVFANKSINGATTPELRDDSLSPKLTGTYRITDVDKVTLSAYQAVRTPGLPETYWWYNGQTHGVPELKPEKNNAVEAAYQRDFGGRGAMRLTAYYYHVQDYIMFRNDPTWRGVYNIDQVDLTGANLEGRVRLTERLSGRAYVNYQMTRKTNDPFDTAKLTDRLDYLPEWKAGAGLDIKLPYGITFSATGRYVGERRTIYAYNPGSGSSFRLVNLGSYVTADLEAKMRVTDHGEISIYAENVLDKQYEEQYGYPLPGRIVGVAVKAMF